MFQDFQPLHCNILYESNIRAKLWQITSPGECSRDTTNYNAQPAANIRILANKARQTVSILERSPVNTLVAVVRRDCFPKVRHTKADDPLRVAWHGSCIDGHSASA
jgi:hypothetical protein